MSVQPKDACSVGKAGKKPLLTLLVKLLQVNGKKISGRVLGGMGVRTLGGGRSPEWPES